MSSIKYMDLAAMNKYTGKRHTSEKIHNLPHNANVSKLRQFMHKKHAAGQMGKM
jgi:hypothetical protein